jgi:sigma-B regulation protein RsbU (phosphoserine phosphatase)
MADVARLVIEDPAGPTARVLDRFPFMIGRLPDNALVIPEPDVSRQHAEIVQEGNNYILRDKNSTFGTFVNDRKIEGDHRLAHGDHIRFGSPRRPPVEFQVVTDEITSRFGVGGATLPGLPGLPEDTKMRGQVSGRSMNLLGQALRAMAEGRVLEEVLAIVVDQAVALAGAERGFLMLAADGGDSATLAIKMARDKRRRTLPDDGSKRSHSIPARAFDSGKLAFENEVPEGRNTIVEGIRSVLCAPLPRVRFSSGTASGGVPAPGAPIGVLYVDSGGFGKLEDPDLHNAFEQLAAEAAVAIENARLYREVEDKKQIEAELKVAADLQQALLPPSRFTQDPFELAAMTEPCRAIGGDFYEYTELRSGAIGFALGDVSGKGPPAALMAAMIQGILNSHAEEETGPAVALERLNHTLLRRSIQSRFATIAFAIVGKDGRLWVSSAGHNPTYVLRKDGRIESLDKGGLMVGIFPDATYEEEMIQLEPGDLVILYSDGVTEALNAHGEQFEEERLKACLADASDKPAAEVLDHLVKAVHGFAGEYPQADDITALVFRYRGASA